MPSQGGCWIALSVEERVMLQTVLKVALDAAVEAGNIEDVAFIAETMKKIKNGKGKPFPKTGKRNSAKDYYEK